MIFFLLIINCPKCNFRNYFWTTFDSDEKITKMLINFINMFAIHHYHKIHLNNKPIIKCDICYDKYDDIHILQEDHVKQYHNMNSFCPFCFKSFKKKLFENLNECIKKDEIPECYNPIFHTHEKISKNVFGMRRLNQTAFNDILKSNGFKN